MSKKIEAMIYEKSVTMNIDDFAPYISGMRDTLNILSDVSCIDFKAYIRGLR